MNEGCRAYNRTGAAMKPAAFTGVARRCVVGRMLLIHFLAAAFALLAAAGASAQDANIALRIADAEQRLLQDPLIVLDMEQARPLIQGDRSARVRLGGAEGSIPISAKWKPVGSGAQGFNNEPRYELAAYALQKLFLDEPEYVVPPVTLRSMPIEQYRELRDVQQPTLRGTRSVLFLLSFWLEHVTNRDPFDPARFEADERYALHWGNLNILTHLVDHKDSNLGNLLISVDPANPRVFAVDNDVAFRSRVSDVGTEWQRLHVRRLPQHTIERLRTITMDDLTRTLGVLAEFDVVEGLLLATAPGENLNPGRGVRRTGERVQFGLTTTEISDVQRRLAALLRDVDRGRIQTVAREP
jgi:hypothetical protein